jgi:60 kDa SS-A/Ro ribonucleoprotein
MNTAIFAAINTAILNPPRNSNNGAAPFVPPNVINSAGGLAYKKSSEVDLANLALTGTFNDDFYNSGADQIQRVQRLVNEVSPRFLEGLAIYARENNMKDTPVVLLAFLMTKDARRFRRAFPKVIDNGKQLRNFCNVVRCGVTGRKSFGTAPKRLVQDWLNNRSDRQIMEDFVGGNGEGGMSLKDVVKLVHPRAQDEGRNQLYRYFLGQEDRVDLFKLPEPLFKLVEFRTGKPGNRTVPDGVPYMMLQSLELSTKERVDISDKMGWQAIRINLNTMNRHGVFNDAEATKRIAAKLRDPAQVRKARAMPYQIFAAYLNTGDDVPATVRDALHDAMEVATANMTPINGRVAVAVDFSGSMTQPVTGTNTKGVASKITCNNVAALIAACIVRGNVATKVYRFDTEAEGVKLEPRDTVMTNAQKIGANGGGTDCASPVRKMIKDKVAVDTLVLISDNQSWCGSYNAGTLINVWNEYKRVMNLPNARLVCIDLAAGSTTQAPDQAGAVLNIGGFSDAYFEVVAEFANGGTVTADSSDKPLSTADRSLFVQRVFDSIED